MTLSKTYIAPILCLAASSAFAYDAYKVEIVNTLSIPRHETVELSLPVTCDSSLGFTVTDANGNPTSWQYTKNGKLLILTDVEATSKAEYLILQPGPQSNGQTVTFAQVRPDLQDDIAWENDRAGYRLYGPSFKKGGGTVHGYDLWSKSVEYPLLSKLYYNNNIKRVTYHKNHGEGFDGYTVGPTLGACMDALVTNGNLHYPTAYKNVEIIENGPIRTSFRVTCYPEEIDGETIIESRVITLDAASPVNCCEVSYNRIPKDSQIATGIVIHADNPKGYEIDKKNGIITVADLTDNLADNNGTIYIGLFSEEKGKPEYRKFTETVANAIGEVMMIYESGNRPFTYYWGADWSQHGIASESAWLETLRNTKKCIENPLKITITSEKK